MIVCIRRIHLRLAALLLAVFVGLGAVLWYGHAPAAPVFAVREGVPITVVVDPGHGGEDGGAVSSGGVEESRLNLEVALRVNDLLRFSGWQTRMTRQEDVSIHSEGADSAREKKVSDLKNRVNLVNGTENAVLLSVHQNSLPSSTVTHGAQVFWNGQPGADDLAEAVQEALNEAINTERAKAAKPIGPSIYLMKNALVPGILVECGFLSNPGETELLQQADHQRKLAAAITAGFLRGMAGEGES
ncbi:N-acetylmuramoyl-L-alanine amidase [uncultured Oscillibacter sp.]|uniref:N-acetylmuramoyl-L-alanine amidase n=1 Tax=uncultured Oscillibacter sp. TaxID=876091 RepID=UPI0025D64CC1|nr:N-acetylmuramoyl-L-alanine amidase [uncultured Oscillibacter sp.]